MNESEVCASRGPILGSEGQPRCAQRLGHPGLHRGFPGSGFEHEFWGDPLMRDTVFASEWSAALLA